MNIYRQYAEPRTPRRAVGGRVVRLLLAGGALQLACLPAFAVGEARVSPREWWEIAGIALLLLLGIGGWIAFLRHKLTVQKQLVAKLSQSEARFRLLFEHSPDAVLLFETQSGTFLDCNDAALEVLRCRRDWLVGKHPWDLAPARQPDGRPSVDRAKEIISHVNRDRSYRFEWLHSRGDGSAFPAEISVTAVDIAESPAWVCVVRDVSASKGMELALRESETKFRLLFERFNDPIMLLELNGFTFVDCNQATLDMLGCKTKEQFRGLSPWSISPEFQPDGTRSREKAEAMLPLIQSEGSHRFEWFHLRLDGTLFPVEVSLTAIQIAERPLLVAIWRDITERRANEEKARQSEELTRTINYFATSLLERDTEDDILWDLAKNCVSRLGLVDCVIYLLDKDRQLLVQRAAMGPKNPEGRVIANAITIPVGKGVVGSVAATGRLEVIGDTSLDPRYIVDDEIRYSELAVPILANGEVMGVIDSEHPGKNFFTSTHVEMMTSIASLLANKLVRVHAEEKLRRLNAELEQRVLERTAELRESEARFRTMVEHAPEAIAIYDADNDRFIEPNDNILRVFGVTREQLAGLSPTALSPLLQPDGRPSEWAARDHIEEALAGGAPVFEWLHRNARGELIPFEIRLVRLPAAGRKLLRASLIDITDRKRAQQTLQEALAREKELSQLKSSFVSTVSHEFRTPLGIISSSAQILERYHDRLAPDKRGEHLASINKSVKRMSSLMEEVLLLSKVESDQMAFRPAELELDVFCRKLADEVTSATHAQCPIVLEVDPVPKACGDENLLRHILTNLLSNAVKYSPQGRPVRLSVQKQNGHVIFKVRDSGMGIPAGDREKLFTAFHRGRNVGTVPGTGLGLTIVKRCVDLHRGTIFCDSVEGQGTTFTVELEMFAAPALQKSAG